MPEVVKRGTCVIHENFYNLYKDVVDNVAICSIAKAAIMILARAGVKPKKRAKAPRKDPNYYVKLLLEAAKKLEE